MSINQKDIIERGNQVALMADIYRSASRIVVWLGEEDCHSRLASGFLEFLSAFSKEELREIDPHSMGNEDTVASLGMYCHMDYWDSLAHLFRRTWFTRIW